MRLLLTAITIFISLCSNSASAKQSISFLSDDIDVQKYFLSSTKVSLGADTVNIILSKLPQYEFEINSVSSARLDFTLERQPKTCVINRIKTQKRASKSIFSKATSLYTTRKLHYLAKRDHLDKEVFEGQSIHSLKRLFSYYPDYVLAITKGNSYGEVIDKQISSLNKRNLWSLSHQNIAYDMHKLVAAQRVDFVLAYPKSLKNSFRDEISGLKTYSLAGVEDFVAGRFSCFPDLSGKKFIKDVNAVLKDLFQSGKLLDIHNYYYRPEFHDSIRENLSKLFSDTTLTN
jgi:uncharacterized protein (TIGR02285 family)